MLQELIAFQVVPATLLLVVLIVTAAAAAAAAAAVVWLLWSQVQLLQVWRVAMKGMKTVTKKMRVQKKMKRSQKRRKKVMKKWNDVGMIVVVHVHACLYCVNAVIIVALTEALQLLWLLDLVLCDVWQIEW